MRKFIFSAFCLVAALFGAQPLDACSNVLVTKGASKDGSVMVTYSADSHQLYGELYYKPAMVFARGTMLDIYEWDSGRYLGQIPQVERTYQTVGNMNEHQLMITETTWGGREELVDPNGIVDYGSLIYITLQRAKTAREAIQVMTELVAEYGYASSGESFSIADKDEVWILEMIGKGSKIVKGKNVNKGAVWVAARIPDGYISAHANHARIHKFPLKDKENWLYSKDVISFAREMGYFDGKDEDFSFTEAYAPADFSALRGCEARVWSAFNILGKGMIGDKKAEEYLDYAMGYNVKNKMPLYIKPAEKVSMKEVADVMRDHYENTPMDMTQDIGAGGHKNPYRWRPMNFTYEGETYVNERAIATQQTGFWILCQARPWLPDEIGGVLWFGVDDAATSCLTPIYTSITEVPECVRVGNGNMLEYSETAAFWLFNRVTHFAYLMYDRVAPVVQAAATAHELGCEAELPKIDEQALYIQQHGGDVRAFLTQYSTDRANDMMNTWRELDRYLLLKYIDGNVKKQGEDGAFLGNGHTHRIPAFPDQPGYSEKWKEAVAKDAAETLKVPDIKY